MARSVADRSLREELGHSPPAHLGTENNQFVKLVEEGVLPSAVLSVSLLHDQLWIHLRGRQKDQSDRSRRWTCET